MVEAVLYSTGCPKCKVLKAKLEEKGVSFVEFSDMEEMVRLGLLQVPILAVDDKFLSFEEAIAWIRSYQR